MIGHRLELCFIHYIPYFGEKTLPQSNFFLAILLILLCTYDTITIAEITVNTWIKPSY